MATARALQFMSQLCSYFEQYVDRVFSARCVDMKSSRENIAVSHETGSLHVKISSTSTRIYWLVFDFEYKFRI